MFQVRGMHGESALITLWPWKGSYDGEGLSPNLGFGQIFDIYGPLELIIAILLFSLGMSSSFVLKRYLSED